VGEKCGCLANTGRAQGALLQGIGDARPAVNGLDHHRLTTALRRAREGAHPSQEMIMVATRLPSPVDDASYLDHALSRLHHPCYDRALSVGRLRQPLRRRLARRCAEVTAIGQAARWNGTFDLVILSDVLHTLDGEAIERLAEQLARHSHPGTEYLAIHDCDAEGAVLSSEDAADSFIDCIGACSVARQRRDGHRVDHWTMD
jgi:hypothetical protein